MLKQEAQERSLPGWHTLTQTTQETKPATSSASVSRADAEEILQQAARLQSDEQERISLSELEALAVERGISPRFVHHALRTYHGSQNQRPTAIVLPRMRLTVRQWRILSVSLSIYWVFIVALPYYLPALTAAMIVLPFLLCFGLGYFLRYKRAGAAVGAAVMLMTMIALVLAATLRGNSTGDVFSEGILYALALWMVCGVAGAALRQWITTRQLPFEPTVLTVSDLDR